MESQSRGMAGLEGLLDTDDVSARLKVAPETVRYWRHAGIGPRFLRIGRHVRYRPADVAAWLEEQLVERIAAS